MAACGGSVKQLRVAASSSRSSRASSLNFPCCLSNVARALKASRRTRGSFSSRQAWRRWAGSLTSALPAEGFHVCHSVDWLDFSYTLANGPSRLNSAAVQAKQLGGLSCWDWSWVNGKWCGSVPVLIQFACAWISCARACSAHKFALSFVGSSQLWNFTSVTDLPSMRLSWCWDTMAMSFDFSVFANFLWSSPSVPLFFSVSLHIERKNNSVLVTGTKKACFTKIVAYIILKSVFPASKLIQNTTEVLINIFVTI